MGSLFLEAIDCHSSSRIGHILPSPVVRQVTRHSRRDVTDSDRGNAMRVLIAGAMRSVAGFYGDPDEKINGLVGKRRFPIVGNGEGVTSWTHLDDAAAATVLALEHDGGGIYNIVDDEPAAARDWLSAPAKALVAKPPRHIRAGLARLIAGNDAVIGATQCRGASNAKAKRELGWTCGIPAGETVSRPPTGQHCEVRTRRSPGRRQPAAGDSGPFRPLLARSRERP
jgi:hypothetical protein